MKKIEYKEGRIKSIEYDECNIYIDDLEDGDFIISDLEDKNMFFTRSLNIFIISNGLQIIKMNDDCSQISVSSTEGSILFEYEYPCQSYNHEYNICEGVNCYISISVNPINDEYDVVIELESENKEESKNELSYTEEECKLQCDTVNSKLDKILSILMNRPETCSTTINYFNDEKTCFDKLINVLKHGYIHADIFITCIREIFLNEHKESDEAADLIDSTYNLPMSIKYYISNRDLRLLHVIQVLGKSFDNTELYSKSEILYDLMMSIQPIVEDENKLNL